MDRQEKEIYYKERDYGERRVFECELAKIPEETDVIILSKAQSVDESGVQKEMNPIRGRAKRGVKLYAETSGKRIKKDTCLST